MKEVDKLIEENQEDLKNIQELQNKIKNKEKSKSRITIIITVIFLVVLFGLSFYASDHDEKNKTDSMSWGMLILIPFLAALYALVVGTAIAIFDSAIRKNQQAKSAISSKYYSNEKVNEIEEYKTKIRRQNMIAGIIAGVILFVCIIVSIITSSKLVPIMFLGLLVFIVIYIIIASKKSKIRFHIKMLEENIIEAKSVN